MVSRLNIGPRALTECPVVVLFDRRGGGWFGRYWG
jgi:hypothetical protein